MIRPRLCAVALAVAGLAASAPAHAFTTESPSGGGVKGPSPAPAAAPHAPSQIQSKPAAGESGGYTFSGTSFHLSVTKTGRASESTASPAITPGTAAPSEKPGLFRRTLNWIFGD